MPDGLGLTWDDITYVIGGYGWKARFVGLDGFIVTGSEEVPGVQYNLDTEGWGSYHTGEKKPYTCGSCHTTGWMATGEDGPHQDDLPGMHGIFSEPGVRCEACHGGGKAHADAPAKDNIEIPTTETCGACHSRGADMNKIPAKGGLIRHHEQYQELLASPHKDLGCGECHDAHASSKYDDLAPGEGVRKACAECHDGDALVNHNHAEKGVGCVDCHMPKVVKSATSSTSAGVTFGDISGHLFALDTKPGATLTFKDDDGAEWANGAAPVKFACLKCHGNKDETWVQVNYPKVHGTEGPSFEGQDSCKSCHAGMNADIVEQFEASGHPFKLNKVDGAPPTYPYSSVPDVPADLGLTWDDITYVIGGYGWKARFVGLDGFIITGTEDTPGVQYNLATEGWGSYHTGETKAYTCGTCHTTGWVATGEDGPHQDDLPGMYGTFVDAGVTCEGCHGPGSIHKGGPAKDNIVAMPNAMTCAQCHTRGSDFSVIPAKGGLIRHHEQYQELMSGPHGPLGCTTCHDPHASTKYDDLAPGEGVRKTCDECHDDKVAHSHTAKGATCVTCHMAKVVKSAVSETKGSLVYGDISNHIFSLNTAPGATLTYKNEADAELAQDVPVAFACIQCHTDKDEDWVQTNFAEIHASE